MCLIHKASATVMLKMPINQSNEITPLDYNILRMSLFHCHLAFGRTLIFSSCGQCTIPSFEYTRSHHLISVLPELWRPLGGFKKRRGLGPSPETVIQSVWPPYRVQPGVRVFKGSPEASVLQPSLRTTRLKYPPTWTPCLKHPGTVVSKQHQSPKYHHHHHHSEP